MAVKGYWEARLDCGCQVSLDYAEYAGDAVVDGGRIVEPCVLHGAAQALAMLNRVEPRDE
ncbi:hypothetical protein [Nocardia farcinica]|uniref:hypothetical protein n=1 Tax=Nocardia farcinica TaxID=37329 RepID=UPI00059F5E25|nr:hypothetical protein [Nocardia farcinica]